MKPTSSRWVALGPAFQVLRGLVFGLGILSSHGPAPGSIEGLVYTKIPPLDQIWGLRETVGQSLAFSILLVAWYPKPHRAWGVVLYGLAALFFLMSLAGGFAPRPEAFQ